MVTCCAICKENASTACSVCKKVYYCSVECQRQDWPNHKTTHPRQVTTPRKPYRFSYPGDWESDEVVKAFQNHGFMIITLQDQKDANKMNDYMDATIKLFQFSENEKKKNLKVPESYVPKPGAIVGYDSRTNEMVNFRADMNHLYPDPSNLVGDYKPKFNNSYHLAHDIGEKVARCVYAKIKDCFISFDPQVAIENSVVRVISYDRPGLNFDPHIDPLYFSLSPRGTSVGLQVKNPITGKYVQPELEMGPNDLVVIAGMHIEQDTAKMIPATVHSVFTTQPRVSIVLGVDLGLTRMMVISGTDDEEDALLQMFRKKTTKSKLV